MKQNYNYLYGSIRVMIKPFYGSKPIYGFGAKLDLLDLYVWHIATDKKASWKPILHINVNIYIYIYIYIYINYWKN